MPSGVPAFMSPTYSSPLGYFLAPLPLPSAPRRLP
eukprot:CAMPEP_0172030882 /NCGR_PEP_ID=MMETSP1041-20130122/18984_1 /TAXON_ID=464988 /ORGANISM="Hemiselmis andersenii, Strain CCMP439" /LENGTH=34 /DNA_ID= /DNA_START= /DNA_END= /DNA_ORIENTATION=